jgi:hypothetical protein
VAFALPSLGEGADVDVFFAPDFLDHLLDELAFARFGSWIIFTKEA